MLALARLPLFAVTTLAVAACGIPVRSKMLDPALYCGSVGAPRAPRDAA